MRRIVLVVVAVFGCTSLSTCPSALSSWTRGDGWIVQIPAGSTFGSCLAANFAFAFALTLTLAGAAANRNALLIVGVGQLNAPFYGGVMVPTVRVIVVKNGGSWM